MLGLTRVGVTTEISAGCSQAEKKTFRGRFSVFRGGEKSESELDLNDKKVEESDWSFGITATTIIIREIK